MSGEKRRYDGPRLTIEDIEEITGRNPLTGAQREKVREIGQQPDAAREAALEEDAAKLVVYGANCAWWDTIDKVATLDTPTGHGLPCCPYCRSVLMQTEQPRWWIDVERYAAERPDPLYPDFIRWLRGKCFPSIRDARAVFEAVFGKEQ